MPGRRVREFDIGNFLSETGLGKSVLQPVRLQSPSQPEPAAQVRTATARASRRYAID
jgi:hypothetical protein